MSSTQYDLDPHFIKCIGYMYASRSLRKGDRVPLQYMLEEAIFQKTGTVKDYSELFQIFLPAREIEDKIQNVLGIFEESKASSSDNELELDLFKEDLMCIVCNGMDVAAKNRLLECADCHSLFHQECHTPVVTGEDSFENWVCNNCKEVNKAISSIPDKKEVVAVVTSTSSKASSSSKSSSSHHRHSSSYKSSSSSSKSSDKYKSSKSSPSHSAMKSSSSSSASGSSGSRSTVQPNINIISADKRIQNMKKKAATKLQEKRKLPR